MKSGTLLLCAILCACIAATAASVAWLGEKVFETYEMRDAEICTARIVALTHEAETRISRAWKRFIEKTESLSPEDFSVKKLNEIAEQSGFKISKVEISDATVPAREYAVFPEKSVILNNNGNVMLLRKTPAGQIRQIIFPEKELFESLEKIAETSLSRTERAKLRIVSVPAGKGFGIIRGLPGAKIEIDLEANPRADSVAARRAVWLAGAGVCVMLAAIFVLALRVISLSEKRYLFAASVSHELKTPIAELRACAETARSRCREPELNHELSAIRHSAQELETIVENLLIFSRMNTGNLRLPTANLSAETLLFPLFERIGDRLVSANTDTVFDIEPEVRERRIRTSPEMLGRILSNLADNAAKYAYREGADNVLTFRVRVDENRLIIDVEDEGPGIPENLRARVFDAFARGNNAGKANGLGLGLALSARIARILGGKLSLLKSDCTGTVFRLELPL